MGSFCTPSYINFPTSSETVEGTEIPAWVAAAGRGLFQNAANIANEPYNPYSGIQQASYDARGNIVRGGNPLSLDERRGGDILREGASSYQPFYDKAGNIADTLGGGYDSMTREELLGDPYSGATREELLGGPFSLETAQPFMDIYQGAANAGVREIEEQTIRAQNEARSRAARGGGGFGSRLGIMEGEAATGGAQAAGDLRAQAAKEGLDFAAGRFDTDRSARFNAEDVMYGRYGDERSARFGAEDAARTAYESDEASRINQMNAYKGQGVDIMNLQNQAAQGLITSGEAKRKLDQQALDIAYASYLDEKQAPFDNINFALGALSGTPHSKSSYGYTTGSQYIAQPSVYGQTIGAAGQIGAAALGLKSRE